jgi:hypothetical protein
LVHVGSLRRGDTSVRFREIYLTLGMIIALHTCDNVGDEVLNVYKVSHKSLCLFEFWKLKSKLGGTSDPLCL